MGGAHALGVRVEECGDPFRAFSPVLGDRLRGLVALGGGFPSTWHIALNMLAKIAGGHRGSGPQGCATEKWGSCPSARRPKRSEQALYLRVLAVGGAAPPWCGRASRSGRRWNVPLERFPQGTAKFSPRKRQTGTSAPPQRTAPREFVDQGYLSGSTASLPIPARPWYRSGRTGGAWRRPGKATAGCGPA